jgi:hypothetical protein
MCLDCHHFEINKSIPWSGRCLIKSKEMSGYVCVKTQAVCDLWPSHHGEDLNDKIVCKEMVPEFMKIILDKKGNEYIDRKGTFGEEEE